jgi:hypothetical protein
MWFIVPEFLISACKKTQIAALGSVSKQSSQLKVGTPVFQSSPTLHQMLSYQEE